MKVPTLLLVGSLAANAVLFAVYRSHSRDGHEAGANARTDHAAQLAARATVGGTGAQAEPEDVLDDTFWKPDSPDDLAPLVARLRAAGFPRYAIRLITMVQLDEMFASRVKEIFPEPPPFWASDQSDEHREKMMAIRALQKEHTALMNQLLGPDAIANSADMEFLQNRRFGDLPPEKVAEINKIASDYNELRMDIYLPGSYSISREDSEKLMFIEKEMQADVAKLLTPEELEEYNLRNSPTASQLRSRLGSFKPTEEEFRALFRVQQAFDQEAGGTPYNSAQYNERQARQAEVDAKMESVLSPERYAEYKVATNPAYFQISRIVARFDLPIQSVVAVDDLRKSMNARATAVRSDTSLTPEQRNAQLAMIAQESNTLAEAILGPRATNAYKEYGGQWLQTIADTPSGPDTPAAGSGTIILR